MVDHSVSGDSRRGTGRVFGSKRELVAAFLSPNDVVLDVGFWGQAVKREREDWPHRLLQQRARDVYGVDIAYDASALESSDHYKKQSAEDFDFDPPGGGFDVIFASEIIEHLSNPGLFLDSCARNLKPGGKLILTTPNAFSVFTILESVFKRGAITTNPDHTLYFNAAVLQVLLEKNGWDITELAYLDTFRGTDSAKRKLIYCLHRLLALFTPKFMETLVVVARPDMRVKRQPRRA